MKYLLTSFLLTFSFLSAAAQSVYIYSKDGGRIDFPEGEVVGIEFAENAKFPLTAPADVAMVDLGLSVRWASCNVGAQCPEDAGVHLAWGELEEKASYSWSTYFDPDCEAPLPSISGRDEYDVAAAAWGGTWRLPTMAEMQELSDRCSWQWTTQNDVPGCLVTGPSGNSIFLPAAGVRQGTALHLDGSYGSLMTGSRDSDNRFYARSLVFFSSADHWIDTCLRDYGQSVRPVCR